MRSLLTVAATLVIGLGFVAAEAFAQDAQGQKDPKEVPKIATYKAVMEGMTWGVSWVKAVKTTVSSLDGVDKTEIDFETKIVTITMKEGKTLTKETLVTAFKDSKYSVKSFEVVGEKKKEDPPKKEEPPKKEDPPKNEDGKDSKGK